MTNAFDLLQQYEDEKKKKKTNVLGVSSFSKKDQDLLNWASSYKPPKPAPKQEPIKKTEEKKSSSGVMQSIKQVVTGITDFFKPKQPGAQSPAVKAINKVDELLFGSQEKKIISPIPEPVKKPEAIKMPEKDYLVAYPQVVKLRQDTLLRLETAEKELKQSRTGRPGIFTPTKNIKPEQTQKAISEVQLVNEIPNLKKQLLIYEQFLGKEQIDRGFIQALWAGAKNPAEMFLPFVKDTNSIRDLVDTFTVAQKYKTGEKLNNYEKSQIQRIQANRINQLIDRGIAYKAGEVVADIPHYLIEFAVTSGGYNATKTATTQILKKVAKDQMPEVATKLVSSSIGSIAQGSLMVPQYTNRTLEYMLPAYEVITDKKGESTINKLVEGEDFTKAFTKAYLTTIIETATERVGIFVEKPVEFLAKATIGKFIANRGLKTVGEFANIAREVGWNGIVGEVFEEEIGEVLQAPIQERKYYPPFATPEGTERLLVETLGISAFGGMAKLNDIAIDTLITNQEDFKENVIDIPVDENLKQELQNIPKEDDVIQEDEKIETTEEKPVISQDKADLTDSGSSFSEISKPSLATSIGKAETKARDFLSNLSARTIPFTEKSLKISSSVLKNFGSFIAELEKDNLPVRKLYDSALKITSKYGSILKKLPGNPTYSIDIKTPESVIRKVIQKRIKNADYPIEKINDVLRSRVIYETTSEVIDAKKAIPNVTYTADYFKTPDITGYRGLNLGLTIDGVRTEIQIHTPESLKVDKVLRPVYDTYRIELEVPESIYEESNKIADQVFTGKLSEEEGTKKINELLKKNKKTNIVQDQDTVVEKKRLELASEQLNDIKGALYSGDTETARKLHTELSKKNQIPSLTEIEEEIMQSQIEEIEDIKEEIGDVSGLSSDDPNSVLVDIANKLVKHFKAPGALFKVTGKKRVYETPEGLKLEVGGTSTDAFDRMIFSTDIDGFSKNIQVLAYKFNKTFTEIFDRIKKGDIDSADYENFKTQFGKGIKERTAYRRGSGAAPKFVSEVESKQDSSKASSKVSGTSSTVTPKYPAVTTALSSKDAAKIDNFELRPEPKPGTEEFKLHRRIVELIRKYAQTIGEGYLPRRALGVYYPETKNIRVDSINNLSVAAHEIAHFLDYVNKITTKIDSDLSTQLKKVYIEYYPGAKSTHKSRLQILEGFATLLQKYVEMPITIENKYPTLVKEFFKPGGKKYVKVIEDILKDLNDIVGEYQGLSSLDKIGARMTSDTTNINKDSFLNFFEKVRTQIADRVYPIEVLAKRTKRFMTKQDPSLWVRAYSSINGIINNNISTLRGYWAFTGLQNGFQKRYNFNWKTLIDSLGKRSITDSFGMYLISRRQHFEYIELDRLKAQKEELEKINEEFLKLDPDKVSEFNRDMKAILSEKYGIDITELDFKVAKKKINNLTNTAIEKYEDYAKVLDRDGFSRKEVDQAYTENKERFKDEERIFDILSNEDINLLFNPEVQLINRTTYNRLKSKEGYASFKREFYDEIVGEAERVGEVRIGGTKVSSLISRKGSGRTIINPLFSALLNHSEIMRKSMKQVVYNQFGSIGTSALMPNLFQETEVKRAVDPKTGKISYPQEKDPNIIMARQDYKRKTILVDRYIKQTIDNLLTYKNIDVFTQFYIGISRMFTKGTTSAYPQFALTNFVVDQITATANSYNKYKPLFSPVSAMLTAIRKRFGSSSSEAKFYEEYLILGGERQTFTGWQDLPPQDLFKKIRGEKNLMINAINTIEKGIDIFSIPSAKSELFSRAVEYINARKAGKSQIVALEEAGRVTAPFHHIGEWGGVFGQTFIRGLPFFNASLQVLDQATRVAGTRSGAVRMTFITIAITAAYWAALMAMMSASDDQKEQYKDLEGEDLANFIYIPNPSGQGLLRIKMSTTFSIPGTVLNMILANNLFKAGYKQRDFMEASTAILPDQLNITDPVKAILGWIPQVFKPISHVVFNVKEYPSVRRLVSMGLERKPKPLQYNEGTSELAKKLGEQLNKSPIKIDYLLTGYFGRASGFLSAKPGIYNPAASIMRDYYFTSGRRVQNFYDTKKETDSKYTAYQNNEKGYENLSENEVREIYRKKVITNRIDELLGEYRDLDPKKDQQKMAESKALFFTYLEKLEDGTEPKDFNKWVKDAKKRRKDKSKDINNPKEKKKKKLF